ncbi:hypothetical protein DIU31_007180 [Mucilaginibacter rubeus]|uniref:Uncharacterized protein n=1 Tax=Mucilaginibacter rubeus TaxID=2027860 RepID=A0AAE6JDW6_9SPHI|nr:MULTISPECIES: hypothetical protein [Mucilaginibacter]QEM03315.1 hypothetical protein DIU31_007180 [Mucilaginibacter rubeus]QEM15933.1 hypothetical protein DIU38_007260 [Mucilaginibacter gossypii]QTE41323.1 hypothetical protein J3L19_20495 [Mucilaginibacter rubeus]QTE47927.1 hypothetical protein J3L21_20480 [Mucilaginibacter rubeus]QTE59320.1 hypothetical protein J3L23_12150 [Mucilaginibacter rubeus]
MIKPYKPWLIALGVLLLLIITNPSISAFKAFRGRDSYSGLKRPLNLFVASVYKEHSKKFIGFFGNFIDISNNPEVLTTPVVADTIKHDSTVYDTSYHWKPPVTDSVK